MANTVYDPKIITISNDDLIKMIKESIGERVPELKDEEFQITFHYNMQNEPYAQIVYL